MGGKEPCTTSLPLCLPRPARRPAFDLSPQACAPPCLPAPAPAVKSSNILLTESGHAKVCDVGLSLATAGQGEDDGLAASSCGNWGTFLYMSPETLLGEAPTPAADV